MPEIYFHVRWPDGVTQRCYSPSTVVEEYFTAGGEYELSDFVERSRTALGIASERVREKFGFYCTGASEQLAQIERTAAGYALSSTSTSDGYALSSTGAAGAGARAGANASTGAGAGAGNVRVIVESLVNADGSPR